MTDHPHRSTWTPAVWETVVGAAHRLMAATGKPMLDVVDVGGGTGGYAVPLAELGHQVTVVDPSPNALATLERRAADAGVAGRVHAAPQREAKPGGRVHAVQGDAAGLTSAVGAEQADLVLCHDVLEFVDDPGDAAAGIAAVLRPAGLASVVVAQRAAAALARVLSGQVADARRLLASPDGTWGPGDSLARRYDLESLTSVLADAGLQTELARGVRVFADLAVGAELDDPHVVQALLELESDVADHPDFRSIAGQLHVLARRNDQQSGNES